MAYSFDFWPTQCFYIVNPIYIYMILNIIKIRKKIFKILYGLEI